MKSKKWSSAVLVGLILVGCLCLDAYAMDDRFLKEVQVQPTILDIDESQSVQISWQQTVVGKVQALICDLDGNIVRPLIDGETRQAGSHSVTWDGKDLNGDYCPVAAYLPIIKIRSERGRTNVHNPTSADWGEEMMLEPPVYSRSRDSVSFQMPKPALCLLRLGKARGGPCYGTLLNWVPRPAGEIEVPWDGKDAQKQIDLGKRKELDFRLITIALPETSILVSASPQKAYSKNTKYKRFPLHPPHGQNVFIHAHHQRSTCKDFTITANMQNTERNWRGQRIARGKVDIDFSLDLDSEHRHSHLKKEGFEIYLYVDDQFIVEERREDVPASISLDTTKLKNGNHFLTVGLRTLEDHMGTYTIKFKVDN